MLKNEVKRIQARFREQWQDLWQRSGQKLVPDMHLPALQNLSLKLKISLPFCLIIVLVITTFWLLAGQRLQDSSQANMEAMGTLLARQTAEAATELMLANDLLSMNVILSQLVRTESIDWAAIYDVDNLEVAAAGTPGGGNSPLTRHYAAPIALQDSIAGHLELGLSDSQYLADRRALNQSYAAILLAGLIFSLAAGLTLASVLTRPLRQIQAAMDQPDDADLNIDPERQDEIGALQRSCQRFLDNYHEQLLALYGDQSAGQPHTGELKARTEASLLCIQACHFSTLLALLNPATLSRRLDEYYGLLGKAAKLYGGRPHRFTGDSLILAFDHQQLEQPTFNAICCGQLFQLLVKNLNHQHRKAGTPTLEFSAAIHSGEVLVSHTGDKGNLCASVMGSCVDESLALAVSLEPAQVSVSASALRMVDEDHPINYEGDNELALDADKPPLVHYILEPELQQYQALLNNQAQYILPGDFNALTSHGAMTNHSATQTDDSQ